MISDILYALEYCKKIVEIERHHISNHAIETILGENFDPRRIGFSYEDKDISSIRQAVDIANMVSTLMPEQWVLVDTGDYIMAENGYCPSDYDNETYDPFYCYYLIPKNIFDKYKEELFKADKTWRLEKQKFADGQVKPE